MEGKSILGKRRKILAYFCLSYQCSVEKKFPLFFQIINLILTKCEVVSIEKVDVVKQHAVSLSVQKILTFPAIM